MNDHSLSPYLRLIARLGNTRHPGGIQASDLLLNRTGLNKSWRVLDVGCGAGHTSAHVAQKYGCLVTGIDVSEDALAQARALYGRESYFSRVNLQKAELFDLPFCEGYFDLVLCESVLLFVANKTQGLSEMARVIKPGGFLLLNELCVSEGPDEEAIRDYFARSELGAFLSRPEELAHYFDSATWLLQVYDQANFSVKDQLYADLTQFGNIKGLLQLLELAHSSLTNPQVRSDLWQLGKFLLQRPPRMLSALISLKLLAQKKTA